MCVSECCKDQLNEPQVGAREGPSLAALWRRLTASSGSLPLPELAPSSDSGSLAPLLLPGSSPPLLLDGSSLPSSLLVGRAWGTLLPPTGTRLCCCLELGASSASPSSLLAVCTARFGCLPRTMVLSVDGSHSQGSSMHYRLGMLRNLTTEDSPPTQNTAAFGRSDMAP